MFSYEFFGCIFNEYIILYFCGLELETKDEIVNRAIDSESQAQNELKDIFSNIDNEVILENLVL